MNEVENKEVVEHVNGVVPSPEVFAKAEVAADAKQAKPEGEAK